MARPHPCLVGYPPRPTITPMFHALLQILLYGVLAGASPMAVAATITVMQAGRPKALAFGTGFVGPQLFTCALFVGVDVAAVGVLLTPPAVRSVS